MEIEFAGRHDKKTYFKAVSWVLKPPRRKRITRTALTLLAIVIFFAYLTLFSQQGNPSAYDTAKIIRHSLSLLFLLYFLVQPYLTAYRMAVRLWNDPFTLKEIKGRVSSQGVFIPLFKDGISWDSFVKVQQSEELVVLVTAGNNFIALPRSFFSTDADWNSLVQMVERRVVEAV